MIYYQIPAYCSQVNDLYSDDDLAFLNHKTLLISGASGAICSYMIDAILAHRKLDVTIVALAVSVPQAKDRFSGHLNDPRLSFVECDLTEGVNFHGHADFVIHAASYTDPAGYAAHPIDTMLVNFLGTKSMLDIAATNHARFMLLSTCEVYGQVDRDEIGENDYGLVDPLSSRSCYNQSKLASETLSICYKESKGVDVVIPRFARAFGPTTNPNDTKVATQFLRDAFCGKPIVIKSDGTPTFSYLFIGDAARSIVFLLQYGVSGEAYNVSSGFSIQLKEFAQYLGKRFGVRVTTGQADSFGKSGYSKVTKSILSIDKIRKLGWSPKDNLDSAVSKSLDALSAFWKQ